MALTVAVLGAGGTMGFPMARNLANAGIEVRAWNRSREKAEPLAEDGATVAGSAAEAARGADVILTMLADAEAVLATAEEALPEAGDEAVWLQMSTIGEAGTERAAGLAAQHGVAFVDAPVLGTKQPAEEGKLVVLGSGPEDQRERLAPVLDAVGARTMWVGEAGAGTRLKLVTNSWIVSVVEGGAETIALAQGLGLDPALFFEAIQGGPLDLPYLQTKGKSMIERSFEPSFALKHAAKDAALVEEAIASRDLDLPLPGAIRRRLDEGVSEHGDEDMSATYLTSAPEGAAV
jgi:3-hydroxyisobutyrate dehydrogenase